MSKQGKNIYLRKDGRWEGRYIKGRENGKIKYGYVFGKTYEETEKKLTEKKTEVHKSAGASFDSVASEWLRMQKPELKPSSIAKYTNTLQNYLIPKFGDATINNVTRNDVMEYSRELLNSGGSRSNGLSAKTVNSILSVMKNVFLYASRERNISVADIGDISVKQSQKPLRVLSIPEQQRLSEYLCENLSFCNLGILICLYTGMRIGEICALKWKDMLLDEPCVYVHKTMQRIQLFGDCDQKTKVVILSPKSDCSIRKIPIPDDMLSLLNANKRDEDTFLLTGTARLFLVLCKH